MKVFCHLCGATLRSADQFRRLGRPDELDAVYVCRDEERCAKRAACDPITGKPYEPASRSSSRLRL